MLASFPAMNIVPLGYISTIIHVVGGTCKLMRTQSHNRGTIIKRSSSRKREPDDHEGPAIIDLTDD